MLKFIYKSLILTMRVTKGKTKTERSCIWQNTCANQVLLRGHIHVFGRVFVPKVSVNCIKKFSQDVNLRKCKSPPHPSLQPSRVVKRSSQIPLTPQVSVVWYKAVFVSSRYVPPHRRSIALRDNTGRLCSRLLVSGDVYRPVVFIMIASYSDISHYVT